MLIAYFSLTLLLNSTAAEEWTVENSRLRAVFHPDGAQMEVVDKTAACVYRTPPCRQETPLLLPRAGEPIRVDGDLAEWSPALSLQLTADMLADAREVDNNADCSAQVAVCWDAAGLYLALRVRDEVGDFAPPGTLRWWERDSAEFWVNRRQIGLSLAPARSLASLIRRELREAKVALRPAEEGYTVEAAVPWSALPVEEPQMGTAFRFAVGVNDADGRGRREGQIYFPRTWVHSAPTTFALAVLADAQGKVPERVRVAAVRRQRPQLTNLRRLAANRLAFTWQSTDSRLRPVVAEITATLPEETAALVFTVDLPDRNAPLEELAYPPPFSLPAEQGALCFSPYANGLLIPADDLSWLRRRYIVYANLDMPWMGLVDLVRGNGYACILETPDDAAFVLERSAEGNRLVPQVVWRPSQGTFRYPRRVRYEFSPAGGYVALAKIYRRFAQRQGLVVTLREKAARNPNLRRLLGASDIWGAEGVRFAREAKAAGIDRLLINGRWSPEAMQEMVDLGYLVGEYDNYVDILDAPEIKDRVHVPVAEQAIQRADGSLQLGWLTWDKKRQYYKRCSALAAEMARRFVPPLLKKYPFNARFCDVTPAEGLFECYHPAHPQTRTEDKHSKQALLRTVREMGLVTGGEHGRAWTVPVADYFEGMMSGGFYSWPAGHLRPPETREGISEAYLTYGLGYYYRIPLWELVFHDCVVTTWYWGDSSGWLYALAPELSDRKDLFNLLYGTIPLMWARPQRHGGYGWKQNRERFLQTYRNTCKAHERTGFDEMLTHEFVTPDRAVQHTRFSSGVEVFVNFGEEPYRLEFEGQTYLLAPHGFLALGNGLRQYRTQVGDRAVTFIQTPDYLFADANGKRHDFGAVVTAGQVTVRVAGPHLLRLNLRGEGPVQIRPARLVPDWDRTGPRVFVLDERGERQQVARWQTEGEAVTIFPAPDWANYELAAGPATAAPDLQVTPEAVTFEPPAPTQGQPVTVRVKVRNTGRRPVGRARVRLFLDREPEPTASEVVTLPPGGEQTISLRLPTETLDGRHQIRITLTADEGERELIAANNETVVPLTLSPDWTRWSHRLSLRVDSGDHARRDEPVVWEVDFATRLGEAAARFNPASVRVVETDAQGRNPRLVPAQFEPQPQVTTRGELVWILTGETPPHTTRYFQILSDATPGRSFRPPFGGQWKEEAQAVETLGYRAEFEDGVIVRLYNKLGQMPQRSLWTGLVYSSGQTGWVREQGTVDYFRVLAEGPARTVVAVRKTLTGGVVYEKTYFFYPRRFDLHIRVTNPAGGDYSRAYYGLSGQFEDNAGHRAVIDGQGDGEGIIGQNPRPQWYVVYTPEWAHSCVAQSEFGNLTYWDAGAWGGVSFNTSAPEARLSYVFHPGQPDARFGAEDYARLHHPPQVIAER